MRRSRYQRFGRGYDDPVIVNNIYPDGAYPRFGRYGYYGSGTIVKLGLVSLVALGAYQVVDSAAEGSAVDNVRNQAEELLQSGLGKLTDPPVEKNPACITTNPPANPNLRIDPAEMPMLCGTLLPYYDEADTHLVHPDGDYHLGLFVDNQFSDNDLETISENSPSAPIQMLDSLSDLNKPEVIVQQLNFIGVCSDGIGRILAGVEDTHHSSGPLIRDDNGEVGVKLYQEDSSGSWRQIETECR